jgi:hypothetical protein
MVQKISKDEKTGVPFTPGDVVSVQAEDGQFAVMKILASDEVGVYGLLYAQLFTERPRIVNIHGLPTAHFALTHERFALFQPETIAHKLVTEDELRGHPLWTADITKTVQKIHDAAGKQVQ